MSEKLKVVLACDTFAPDINGAARFAERLAAGLAKRGHEVHVIAASFDSSHGTREERHDGAELIVHRLKSHRVPNHKSLRWVEPWGLTSQIEKLLREIQPAALHVQSHLLVGRFAIRAARKAGIKTLATNHIMPENLIKYSFLPEFLHKPAMDFIWRDAGRILSRMDAVTTPTRRAADLLERATGITGVMAISCGIEAAKFANSTPTQNHNPRLLFLGRLDDEKRIHILLKAVASLTDHPRVIVELVGDGGERVHLEQLALKLGISDRVIFTGHISDAELPLAYERATVFVMPSIAELQSIATMEAMASGRPVIAANAMALPHLVHNGDNGYLFEPDNVEDLASKLRLILEAEPQELERMSQNSLHLIQSHDINRTLDIFENLYRGIGTGYETMDNEPGYLVPIGKLSETLSGALASWRAETLEIRRKAEALSSEARERLSGASEELREQLEELKEEVIEQIEELKDAVKKQAKKLRRKDEGQ
ncbi:MAG: glycosyltransferase family 4 protein [Actinobacteria bacterium]|nr:glycosyltransferase family 4 protein [Actinomycetota bacterium]